MPLDNTNISAPSCCHILSWNTPIPSHSVTLQHFDYILYYCFYHTMLLIARQVIRPSICDDEVLCCGDMDWNTSKIISWLISLGFSLPQHQVSATTETPQILARIGVGYWKKWLSVYKLAISLKRLKTEWKLLQTHSLSIGAKMYDLDWPDQ